MAVDETLSRAPGLCVARASLRKNVIKLSKSGKTKKLQILSIWNNQCLVCMRASVCYEHEQTVAAETTGSHCRHTARWTALFSDISALFGPKWRERSVFPHRIIRSQIFCRHVIQTPQYRSSNIRIMPGFNKFFPSSMTQFRTERKYFIFHYPCRRKKVPKVCFCAHLSGVHARAST